MFPFPSVYTPPIFKAIPKPLPPRSLPFSSACSLPTVPPVTPNARSVHLINTFLTRSRCTMVTCVQICLPHQLEKSQGRGVILLHPQSWALSRSRSVGRVKGAFSLRCLNTWACSVSPISPFLEPVPPHPLPSNLLTLPHFGVL